MYCSQCGKEIPDGSKACPLCGASFVGKSFSERASDAFDSADREFASALHDVNNTINGVPGGNQRLKDDRGLAVYILLSIITCGIYGYYFIYKMAHDVNIACEGDGEKTSGLVAFIVLSFFTCGIYEMIWEYKLGNRLSANAPRYGMTFQENGTTVLMWRLFGILLCCIGPFISMHILIKNSNLICAAYNRANNL